MKLSNLLLAALLASNVHADSQVDDSVYQVFSRALQLEARWARVKERSLDRYLVYLDDKGAFRGLDSAAVLSLKDDLRTELSGRLSWDTIGNRFVSTAMSACDDDTLKQFARYYNQDGLTPDQREQVAEDYLACGVRGIKQAMVLVQEVFRQAAPEVGKLIKRYRRPDPGTSTVIR